MKQQSKQVPQEQQDQTAHQAQASGAALEFSEAEELLRYDRKNAPVPPGIGQRLSASIAAEPAKKRPWWKRWSKTS
jgi:hypothetical protein